LAFMLASWRLNDAPRSPFWWAEVPLYALMLWGMWRLHRRRPAWLPLTRRTAPWAYFGLCWTFGMTYELSLTIDGTGIGGVHPDTRASFILAQGDYVLIALACLALVRWLRLDFAGVFAVAGGKSLTEGMVFSGVLTAVLLSAQWWASPFFLAYYTMVYATFTALPLLFVNPRLIWASGTPGMTRLPALWASGFAVAFGIRVIWGLGWGPVATWAFALPPNPL
jgi:hypothetical protein